MTRWDVYRVPLVGDVEFLGERVGDDPIAIASECRNGGMECVTVLRGGSTPPSPRAVWNATNGGWKNLREQDAKLAGRKSALARKESTGVR